MIRLTDVVIDCPDPNALARFYSGLTGWPLDKDAEDWASIRTEGHAALAFQRADDHRPPHWPDPERPQQMHLDFEVDDFAPARARAEELGAEFVEAHVGPRGYGWMVMTDPAGHPFCLTRQPNG
ncbi:VOC family protein [Phytomonospora endophytica]|uniref:Putative enzyme related to lactoylglutathione lyase n=1 Tax=Phytomonospora endophytica TaxID=714109 RepID=A0A841FTP8_9ACTN|nr:VOC family protein [Phytomonospora endophytica]MBB6035350.1 putative enzyme related to lactoylglutathione lyase [Phytomonospora endophytica]GIG63898.1 glyoxalase [Phytomonospora endophytica]